MTTTITPPITQRAYCLAAIDAHTAAYERAYRDLRTATTEAERDTAYWFMNNAEREIERWQKALEAAQ